MEYLEGLSLDALLEKLGRLPVPQVLCFSVADRWTAWSYAHDKGLVHLDIKPANIFLPAE